MWGSKCFQNMLPWLRQPFRDSTAIYCGFGNSDLYSGISYYKAFEKGQCISMLPKFLRKFAYHSLWRFGYEIVKLPRLLSLEAALNRVAANPTPLDVRTVIDVGASDGRWSAKVMPFYPQAFYFLIEAQSVHEEALRAFKQAHQNVDYILAAAGDTVGDVYFDNSMPFSGAAFHEAVNPDLVKMPSTTIDEQVRKLNLQPPYLLKLDTHGFEVPILTGASQTLKQTNMIIIETYNFKINNQTALRFPEMTSWLEDKGFRVADLIEPLYRPIDRLLWQFDLLLLPATRPEFALNSYT